MKVIWNSVQGMVWLPRCLKMLSKLNFKRISKVDKEVGRRVANKLAVQELPTHLKAQMETLGLEKMRYRTRNI